MLQGHQADGVAERCQYNGDGNEKWILNEKNYLLNNEEEILIPMNGKAMVEVYAAVSKTGKLCLLSDSGADRSVVKDEVLREEAKENGTMILHDLSGSTIMTQGRVSIKMETQERIFEHKFQVLNSLGYLKADGLLGRDFLWGRAVMDMVDGIMKWRINKKGKGELKKDFDKNNMILELESSIEDKNISEDGNTVGIRRNRKSIENNKKFQAYLEDIDESEEKLEAKIGISETTRRLGKLKRVGDHEGKIEECYQVSIMELNAKNENVLEETGRVHEPLTISEIDDSERMMVLTEMQEETIWCK